MVEGQLFPVVHGHVRKPGGHGDGNEAEQHDHRSDRPESGDALEKDAEWRADCQGAVGADAVPTDDNCGVLIADG